MDVQSLNLHFSFHSNKNIGNVNLDKELLNFVILLKISLEKPLSRCQTVRTIRVTPVM